MSAQRVVLGALVVLFFSAAAAKAQETPVYYDYVENGVLKGGRIIVDRSKPDHRRIFGLDRVGAQAQVVWPVTTVMDNGPTANRIDLVMLGDGYTAGEMTTYEAHVDAALADFFSEEPFAAYSTYFNVHRVDVVSNESGVDEIDLGIFKDTALDMEYGCFNIARLLCINVSKAYDAAASAPAVDQILALANSTRYGGAGYPFDNLGTFAGDNSLAVEIGLHEFGHSFADLADEYDYADGATYTGPEPIEPNVSILTAGQQIAQSTKWYRWMDLPNVDTFVGAMYHQFGLYRPTSNSKMRSLNRPFEQINVEQFVISIYESVSPIDDATPPSAVPLPHTTTFFVTVLEPVDHSLDIQWSIDGTDVPGATSTTFTPSDVAIVPCLHDLSVSVIDNTARVRDPNARASLLTASRQWQIDVPGECTVIPEPGGKTRGLTFTGPASAVATASGTAIQVVPVDLYHPQPGNPPNRPQPNFSAYDTDLNNVCTGPGPLSGYYCQAAADCPGSGTCPVGVGCTATGETNGCARWVGPPFLYLESRDNPGVGSYRAARLQCSPYYQNWADLTVTVVGSEIVPSSTYEVITYASSCKGGEGSCTAISPPVTMTTRRGGDVFAPFNPPDSSPQPEGPDVAALVNKFKSLPGAIVKAIAQVQSNAPIPNNDVDGTDIAVVVDAVKGFAYSFSGPCPCPSTVPCDMTMCSSNGQCAGAPGNYGPGALCVRECQPGSPRAGEPCTESVGDPPIPDLDCGSCSAGSPVPGIPCDANSDCSPGTCATGVCGAGSPSTTGFCHDPCGRCN